MLQEYVRLHIGLRLRQLVRVEMRMEQEFGFFVLGVLEEIVRHGQRRRETPELGHRRERDLQRH